MNLTRREFAKANAAAIAAAAAGLPILVRASNLVTEADVTSLVWNKAPCRFCGTGCSVMVATRDGQVVATHGDIKAEVNRGINCVKGYFLSKIMYGSDRLTRPLLRMKDGKFDKQGEFQPISWEQAFDIMAEKFKAALKAKGPESVGMFGSGQWTVWEGYAANKLFKAGLRSNNIDPNARHCMASAVMGFMRSFGMDEPMGCYDDIEATDSFVLWGSNMAEMHPVLWSRVTDRRLSAPQVKVAVLSTFEHRSFELADLPMVFKPQTDLIILNYIANHIIESGAVNRDFVERHVRFAHGAEDIGYGLRPDDPLEKKAKNADKANTWSDIDFKAFAEFVKPYTLERTARESGVPAERLKALAELYADPKRKVVSFWTMGFNQHTRGVWANNLIYNIHLLTGKISEPGNSPFSLTGQPSACGTAREVGTFSHRLPADLVVTNPKHRETAEKIWKVPAGTIQEKVGFHAVQQSRMLKDGVLNVYWTQVSNNMQAGPNVMQEVLPGWRNPDNFVIVSDVYPTVSAQAADLILPSAMWVEKEGAFGNAERRTQFWHQLVKAPGEAKSDLWQLVEFSKRFTTDEVWPAELLAKAPRAEGQDPLRRAVPQRPGRPLPGQRPGQGLCQRRGRRIRLLYPEGSVRGIRRLRSRPRPRPRPLRRLPRGARPALAGGGRQGDPLALPRGLRPLREQGQRRAVLWLSGQEGDRLRPALRAAGRGAGPGLPVLARHRPGARTLAHREHDRAGPGAVQGGARRAGLHAPGGCAPAQAAPRQRGQGGEPARRDPRAGRDPRAQQAAPGAGVRAVLRRQQADQQGHPGRHRPDFQADRLQEVRRSHRTAQPGLRSAP